MTVLKTWQYFNCLALNKIYTMGTNNTRTINLGSWMNSTIGHIKDLALIKKLHTCTNCAV